MADWLPLAALSTTRKDHQQSQVRPLELHRKAGHPRAGAVHRRAKPRTLEQVARGLLQPLPAKRVVLVALLEESASASETDLLLLMSQRIFHYNNYLFAMNEERSP